MSGATLAATVFAGLGSLLLVFAFTGWLNSHDGWRLDSERRQSSVGAFVCLLLALWCGYFVLRFAGVL